MNGKSEARTDAPVLQEDVDLTGLNTMRVSATAQQFVDVKNQQHLVELFKSGFFERHTPIILGGGSNLLLVGDPQSPVLKISIRGVQIDDIGNGHVLMKAGAGENWHGLVVQAVEKGYGGIENLALIPGTAGAAPIQNIGAYGVELQDCFEELTAFDTSTGTFKTFKRAECRFAYRDSMFKNNQKGAYIICDLSLRLRSKNHQLVTGYKALSDYLDRENIHQPTIRDICNAVVAIRRSKLPDPADIGNAGSFFKNPVISAKRYRKLKHEFPELSSYKLDSGDYKLPAAWLIDQAGWKGKQVGNVGSYENQALVLVNHGGATGREIYAHAMRIRDSVQERFGVDLNPEVNIIGEI